jgi:DNA-binding response OmpR family regulator
MMRKDMSQGPVAGISVLIVDDDTYLADVFQPILEGAGFYVETAATGIQALSKAESTPFKLVIADLKLPDIQGNELSRYLKEMIPGVSVILLNGASRMQKDEKASDKILKKPIDPLELLRASNSLSSNM